MLIPLRAAIRTNNHDGRSQVLDEMPSGAGDGKDVDVGADISKDFEGSMVLEKQVILYADPTNVLEHIRELHVFGV